VFVLAAAAMPATPAAASKLIDRNASGVRLTVDGHANALVTYRSKGRLRHVLVWGAINARTPTSRRPQVRFNLDYSGGWGRFHKPVWASFAGSCRAYDGPRLPWLLAACKAPDGTYWALQSWQVALPDLGFVPWTGLQRSSELHLSHWSGAIATIEGHTDWVYSGRFHEIFGRVTYKGTPVFGFHTTAVGAPTDGYGRLLYLDTFDSVYGPGWRRENSFVAHNPSGAFCYGFFGFDPSVGGYAVPPGYTAHKRRPPAPGKRYRITMEGPGVTPDVMWTGNGLPNFDPKNPGLVDYEAEMNNLLDTFDDRLCRHH
jgi:hypothetical protein